MHFYHKICQLHKNMTLTRELHKQKIYC